MEIIPSKYQEDIFEFTKFGHGNAVISAVAGSGKSTTIINALNYIKPDKRVLFLAFNNSIVEELKKKIARPNTDIKTLHSLGLSILKYNFKDKNIEICEDKYKQKLYSILDEIGFDFSPSKSYIKNIIKLCNLGRINLVTTKDDLLNVANKYGIILTPGDIDELDITLKLINWAKTSVEETDQIDFTDMIYLPNVLNVRVFKYDFVIIDEAQDLSRSQMELFMKCFKQGSRFLAVGDENQCINGFAGSDIESFSKLKKMPNTIQLPLSICYRCGKNIVKFAQKIVPEIEYNNESIDGTINFKSTINDVTDGDMVICRTTTPLIKLYINLISKNINCYLKGKDIGVNLLELLEFTESEELNDDGLFGELSNMIVSYIDKNKELTKNNESDIKSTQEFNDLVDKIECIKILSNGLKNKSELKDRIQNIFSDDNKKGICLSTIHKAKGLEADNVFILNKHLIPSKFSKQDWELEQEKNLEYVAYTRPKKMLGFIYDN